MHGSSENIVYTICHDAFERETGDEPYEMTGMHLQSTLKHASHGSIAAVLCVMYMWGKTY